MEAVRPATDSDFDRLTQLLEEALGPRFGDRVGEGLFRRSSRRSGAEDRLRLALIEPDRGLFCGLLQDYVVGLCLTTVDREFDDATLGVVEELYVEPAAREMGVGRLLLDEAVRWCVDRGCTAVEVEALPGDRLSKNLFERSGFRARSLTMHRPLDLNEQGNLAEE